MLFCQRECIVLYSAQLLLRSVRRVNESLVYCAFVRLDDRR